MANEEHLGILRQGVDVWNRWRVDNNGTRPDLGGADLNDTSLYKANLSGALLAGAQLRNADLGGTNLSGADLSGADIRWANVSEADLTGANLSGANLEGCNLSETNFENADLTGCRVYAISAWNLKTNKDTKQLNLIVTRQDESPVRVDDLEVAQFVYLLLNREKLRNVLQTVTAKTVLLLGRFTEERKAVLDALAAEVRKNGLVPIIFDFDRPSSRDFTETVKILAGLSLFVIVDITKPKSAPQELSVTIPDYGIPFVPILQAGEEQYSMFGDFKKYDWLLRPIRVYDAKESLVKNFRQIIFEPAWEKQLELQQRKAEELKATPIEEMISARKAS